MDVLEDIKNRVDIPLVLHGGSANPDEEIAKAVQIGIQKSISLLITNMPSTKMSRNSFDDRIMGCKCDLSRMY